MRSAGPSHPEPPWMSRILEGLGFEKRRAMASPNSAGSQKPHQRAVDRRDVGARCDGTAACATTEEALVRKADGCPEDNREDGLDRHARWEPGRAGDGSTGTVEADIPVRLHGRRDSCDILRVDRPSIDLSGRRSRRVAGRAGR